MTLASHATHAASSRLGGAPVAALVTVLVTSLLLPLGVAQAATAVPLGTAASFAILAGSTITNTGPSTVAGDVGLHPGTSLTGFDEVTHDGSQHIGDGTALQAKADLDTAYTNALGQMPVTRIATELGETIVTAGVYDSAAGTFGVTGTLTLDGEGDPDAVFIFQMGSTLTTASASRVELINSADLCNVYWQVGSSATLGANSTFLGTIMADQSVTLGSAATVAGRVLARSAAVTMNTNTITNSTCETPPEGGTSGGTTTEGTTTDGTTTEGTTTNGTTTAGTTTGDGDTTAGGSTAGGTTAGGTTAGGTTAGGTTVDGATAGTTTEGTTTAGTTDQVEAVPAGPVAAGGGGVETATTGASLRLALVFVLLMVGGTVGIMTRRRVRA